MSGASCLLVLLRQCEGSLKSDELSWASGFRQEKQHDLFALGRLETISHSLILTKYCTRMYNIYLFLTAAFKMGSVT